MSFVDSFNDTIGGILGGSKDSPKNIDSNNVVINSHNITNDVSVVEAKKCNAFRSAVHIISRSIGEVTFACDNKKINKLFERPNDWQTGQEFFEAVSHDLLVYGEALIELIGANPQRPLMLATHDPSKIRTKVDSQRRPSYVIPLDGGRIIPNERMVRIRDISTSSVRVEPRLHALRYQVQGLNGMTELANTIIENGLNVSYLISSNREMTAKERKNNAAMFKGFKEKEKNSSALLQLEGGMTLSTVPGLSPIEASQMPTYLQYITDIATAFGVPAWLIGGPVNSKYNNMSQQIQHMNRNAISPILGKISKAFSIRLGIDVSYDDSILLRGDSYAMNQMYLQQLQAGAITPNEFREAVGWDRCDVEGADELRPIKLPVSANSPGGPDSDQQTNPPERQTNPPTTPSGGSEDPEG